VELGNEVVEGEGENVNIIKPSFEIEDVDGERMLRNIERAGRTCYKSEDKMTPDSARKFVAGILARGHESVIEHEKVTVRIVCDRGCCYSEDTKVLTEVGWKYFSELSKTDRVFTKDERNKLLSMKPKRIIKEKYVGKMLNFHTTQLDLVVTPNHKMWVYDYHKRSDKSRIWKFMDANNLKNTRYVFSKGAKWGGKSIEVITIPSTIVKRGFYDKEFDGAKYDAKTFLKFLGIWVTDGSISFGKKDCGHRIVISQTKYRNQVEHILDGLSIKYTKNKNDYRISNKPLFEYLLSNFIQGDNTRKTYYLKVPTWIKGLNPQLLSCFLEGVILGDGTPHTGGHGYQIYTASKDFAEDLVEIAMKVGKTANYYCPEIRSTPHRLIQQRVPAYVVSIIETVDTLYNRTPDTYVEINYDGFVYCVELPKHHRLYVMRHGKPCWCGNSHEIVRHRLASYSQESTRYCNYAKKDEITVIEPCFFPPIPADTPHIHANYNAIRRNIWYAAMKACEKAYMELILNGAKPEEARSVLPNSLKTEIVVTMNLREWRHFFKLRTTKKAHPQMREISIPLLQAMKTEIPVVFDDIIAE
jgi:thymidylate synthase ThyX